LHNPEFRADKLDLAKQQMYTGIARRNDEVSSIVGRESAILTFGKDNPFARVEEFATVAAVRALRWSARLPTTADLAGRLDAAVVAA